MHGQPPPFPYDERRHAEATILAFVLTADQWWSVDELARRLHLPADLVRLATATLSADGLLTSAPIGGGKKLRASWTAVRSDELMGWCDSIKRRVYVQAVGGEIPIT
jgi:hypothetical protein